jgi:hypothetical protein
VLQGLGEYGKFLALGLCILTFVLFSKKPASAASVRAPGAVGSSSFAAQEEREAFFAEARKKRAEKLEKEAKNASELAAKREAKEAAKEAAKKEEEKQQKRAAATARAAAKLKQQVDKEQAAEELAKHKQFLLKKKQEQIKKEQEATVNPWGSDAGSSAASSATPAEQNADMSILLSFSNQKFALKVNGKADTIAQVKSRLAKITSVPDDAHKLIFMGQVLQNEKTLSSYSATEGTVLHLMVASPHKQAALSGLEAGETGGVAASATAAADDEDDLYS